MGGRKKEYKEGIQGESQTGKRTPWFQRIKGNKNGVKRKTGWENIQQEQKTLSGLFFFF